MLRELTAVLFLFFVQIAGAAPSQWTDPTSARDYLLLDGTHTWEKASALCQRQGMVVLDIRYLSDAERKAFIEGPLLAAVPAVERFPGTPRTTLVSDIWQSRRSALTEYTISGGFSQKWFVPDYNTTILVVSRKGGKTGMAVEWREAPDQTRAVCMSVENFWYSCAARNVCHQRSELGNLTVRKEYVEFGATETEARNRTIESLQAASMAAPGCAPDLGPVRCSRLLP